MSDTFVTNQLANDLGLFGLGDVEAAIYLHLINKQPKTILQIARDLDLPRSSVYDNAIKLSDRGLVEKIVTFKSQKLRAYPPEILQGLIDKEKARVESLQDTLATLQNQLAQNLSSATTTEVRYYTGTKGFQQMLWNTLKAKEIIGYSEFGRAEVVSLKYAIKLHDELIKRGIKDRVITNPNPEVFRNITGNPTEQQRKLFQSTRILKTDQLYVSGDTSIYNNTFAVGYWKQGEIVGVEIDNPELVRTQKSIFEILWKIAEPIDEYLKTN